MSRVCQTVQRSCRYVREEGLGKGGRVKPRKRGGGRGSGIIGDARNAREEENEISRPLLDLRRDSH